MASLVVSGVPSFSKSPEVGERNGLHWVVKAYIHTHLFKYKVRHTSFRLRKLPAGVRDCIGIISPSGEISLK